MKCSTSAPLSVPRSRRLPRYISLSVTLLDSPLPRCVLIKGKCAKSSHALLLSPLTTCTTPELGFSQSRSTPRNLRVHMSDSRSLISA